MAHTIFDVHVRTIECSVCGAPVATEIQGGQVECEYCNSVNIVTNRKRASRAGEKPSMADEVARLARLKAQVENPLTGHAYDMERPPLGWSVGEVLNPAGRERANQEWSRARAGGTPDTPEEQRKLCWLAMCLADAQRAAREPLKARAVLETALGILGDEGHRHLIRCRLATEAIEEGDHASAQGWLEECDPAPEVLELDSAYRLALALLRVRQGNAAAALSVVGMQNGDVPLDEPVLRSTTLMRVHALELSRYESQAEEELSRAIERFGQKDVLPYLDAWGLAPQTRHRAQQAALRSKLSALVSERLSLKSGFLSAASSTLVRLPLWALILLIPIAATRCVADADPLFGVYGHVLCPEVCDDCRGPARVVTVWTGGNGSYSSNGAQYFCPANTNNIDDMTDEQLEFSSHLLTHWELSWIAAVGASFLIVLVLLLPFAPFLIVRRKLGDGGRAAELDQGIAAIAQQLREPPPPRPPQPLGGLAWALFVFGGSIAAALLAIVIGLAW